jgi:hypothetical protein
MLNLPLTLQKGHLPHRHPASCYPDNSRQAAAALADSTSAVVAPVVHTVPAAVRIGLVAVRIVPDLAHTGCCRSSLRWKMAGRAGCRSRVEAGRSPGLGRGSHRARDRHPGGWEVAIAGRMAVRLGPWDVLALLSHGVEEGMNVRISGMPLRRCTGLSCGGRVFVLRRPQKSGVRRWTVVSRQKLGKARRFGVGRRMNVSPRALFRTRIAGA